MSRHSREDGEKEKVGSAKKIFLCALVNKDPTEHPGSTREAPWLHTRVLAPQALRSALQSPGGARARGLAILSGVGRVVWSARTRLRYIMLLHIYTATMETWKHWWDMDDDDDDTRQLDSRSMHPLHRMNRTNRTNRT
jgi:hypothetical protein